MESLISAPIVPRATFTESLEQQQEQQQQAPLPQHFRTATLPPTSPTVHTPTMSLGKDQNNTLAGSYLVKPLPRTIDESMSLEWVFGLNTDHKAIVHNLSTKTFNSVPSKSILKTLSSPSSSSQTQANTLSSNKTTTTAAATTNNNNNIHSREIRKVFYAIGHVGVIYDVIHNTQRHLLGHAHTIIASSATFNKRFVATIDEGDRNLWSLRSRKMLNTKTNTQGKQDISSNTANNNTNYNTTTTDMVDNSIDNSYCFSDDNEVDLDEMLRGDGTVYAPELAYKPEEDDGSLLIIWDTTSCLPVQTIPIGKFGGARCVAISADGLYVAVINCRTPQQLLVWGWTADQAPNSIVQASQRQMSHRHNRNKSQSKSESSSQAPFRSNLPMNISPNNKHNHREKRFASDGGLNNIDNTSRNSVSVHNEIVRDYDEDEDDLYDDDDEDGDDNELQEQYEESVLLPEYVRLIPSNDVQTSVKFGVEDAQMLCSNGKRRVFFWSWSEGVLKYYSPPNFSKLGNRRSKKAKPKNNVNSNDKNNKQLQSQEEQEHQEENYYQFTQTILIPGTSMAASGSHSGHLILWEVQPKDRVTKQQDKTLLKTIHAHSSGVNCITYQNGTIVTGGNDGHVKFFDLQLRMVAWFDALCAGPIYAISFDKSSTSLPESISLFAQDNNNFLSRAGMEAANAFYSPNFMIATSHAMIIDIPAASFHAGVRNTLTKGRLIVQGQHSAMTSVTAHPTLPRLALGGLSGQIHLFDYVQRRVLILSLFKQLAISCLLFNPAGTLLAVGCTNGQVKFLHSETLEEVKSFRPKRMERVNQMCFSADGRMMAVGTLCGCVGLYEYKHPHTNHTRPLTWEFIGFHKTHRGAIAGLQFGYNTQGELIRLLSIGVDKRLIEYNLVDSHTETGLLVRTAHKITQGALPTGFLWTKDKNLLDRKSQPRQLQQTWTKDNNNSNDEDEDEGEDEESEEETTSSNSDDDEEEDEEESINDEEHTQPAYSAEQSHQSEMHRRLNRRSNHTPIKMDYLLIATDDYKIKVYQSDWNRQCVKTLLSPTFGGPIQHMAIVTNHTVTTPPLLSEHSPHTHINVSNNNNNNNPASKPKKVTLTPQSKWLVYTTAERVIGLMSLPLIGDPCANSGLLAHPREITSMAVSFDGQRVFTCGGVDQSVMQWRVNGIQANDMNSSSSTTSKLISSKKQSEEKQELLLYGMSNENNSNTKDKNNKNKENRTCAKGEVPLDHLLCMIDGGAKGQMVKEIIDYFYYAQVRAQGEITTAKRELLGAIHFSQLPHLLRALGYYPSELEMGHLAYEVANMYSPKSESLAEVDVDAILLNFAQFVRLYVNHRPLKGVTRHDIEHAFMNIARYVEHSSELPTTTNSKEVTSELSAQGQQMKSQTRNNNNNNKVNIERNKLFELLGSLGEPLKNSEISAAITSLLGQGVHLNMLPALLNSQQFAQNFLGFDDYADSNGITLSQEYSGHCKDGESIDTTRSSVATRQNKSLLNREGFINANINGNNKMKKATSNRHANKYRAAHRRQGEQPFSIHDNEELQHSESEEEEEDDDNDEDEDEEHNENIAVFRRPEVSPHRLHGNDNDAGSDSDISSELIDEVQDGDVVFTM